MTSIRRRILLPLVPLTAVVLLVVALGIDAAVRRDLEGGFDRALLALGRGVAAAVDVELGGELEFEAEGVEPLGFEDPKRGAFYTVTYWDGAVVASSLSPAPGPFSAAEEEPAFSTHQIQGRRTRICVLPVERFPEDDEEDREDWREEHPGEPLPEPEAQVFTITVGQPTEEMESTLATLRGVLSLGFGALFLFLVVAPTLVVSRALGPLKRLSAQADRLGPDRPKARLGEPGVDKEVTSLVAALNRALDRLVGAYERQKRFTADAAHELRTPLSAVRAHCEVALRKPRTPEELRETLEVVQRTSLRLGEMVERLLALARIQRGEITLPGEPVDLAEVAGEAVGANTPGAETKGVLLKLDLFAPPCVDGDRNLLTECISNLVENAVRYTPEGGRVTVSVDTDEGAPRVAVVDDGIGIPREHMERIFDRFYRVDPARSRAEGGAGLGLAIADEIARLHGAEIRVASRSGDGSRFELRFPVAPP